MLGHALVTVVIVVMVVIGISFVVKVMPVDGLLDKPSESIEGKDPLREIEKLFKGIKPEQFQRP